MNEVAQWLVIATVTLTLPVLLYRTRRYLIEQQQPIKMVHGELPVMPGPNGVDILNQRVSAEDICRPTLDVGLSGYVVWLSNECPTCELISAEIPDGFGQIGWSVVLRSMSSPSASTVSGTLWARDDEGWQADEMGVFEEKDLGEVVRSRGFFPMLIVVQQGVVASILGGIEIVELFRGLRSVDG